MNFENIRRGSGLIKRAGVHFIALADRVAFQMLPSPRPMAGRVLLIRLDDIGDFVIWLDAAREIRRLYPRGQFELTLAANAIWAPLAEVSGLFDHVVPISVNRFLGNPRYRFQTMEDIRRGQYSMVIHATSNRRYYDSVLVAAAAAPMSMGHCGEERQEWPAIVRNTDRWYSLLIDGGNLHYSEFEKNAELVRALGNSNFIPATPILDISGKSPSAELKCFDGRSAFYILFPGAKDAYRRWPPERFAQVAMEIFRQTQWPGVICGSTGDAQIAQTIVNFAKETPLVNFAGKTSLVDLAILISHARLIVTNDTGASHIAAAVGTPTVTILGGGQFGRFMPYPNRADPAQQPAYVTHPMDCFGCNWHCKYSNKPGAPMPCIDRVAVEDAMVQIEPIIKAHTSATV